jgi:hypothetical protein
MSETINQALSKMVLRELEETKRQLADCQIAMAMLGDKHEQQLHFVQLRAERAEKLAEENGCLAHQRGCELAEVYEQRDSIAKAALYLADVAEKNTDDPDLWENAIATVKAIATLKGDNNE